MEAVQLQAWGSAFPAGDVNTLLGSGSVSGSGAGSVQGWRAAMSRRWGQSCNFCRDAAGRGPVPPGLWPGATTRASAFAGKKIELNSSAGLFGRPVSVGGYLRRSSRRLIAVRRRPVVSEKSSVSTSSGGVDVQGEERRSKADGDGGEARAKEEARKKTDYETPVEGAGGASERQFVSWFRESWPYIQEHQGCTFVVVIPGNVVSHRKTFYGILQDVALLHGLGIRLLIVVGASVQINNLLHQRGEKAAFVSGYRITDDVALEAAMEAAGRIRVDIEAKLSRGPAIPMLRRHGENDRWHDVGISVSSGNYVAAKRRGVIDGIDFGATGEVKKVDIARIRERLNSGCVVMLSNLGYSSTGDVLNCNTYDVAKTAAVSLGADKLLCMIDGPVLGDNGRIIKWMTLQKGEELIREQGAYSIGFGGDLHYFVPKEDPVAGRWPNATNSLVGAKRSGWPAVDVQTMGEVEASASSFVNGRVGGLHEGQPESDAEVAASKSTCLKYLSELSVAVDVCMGGVRRVHLVDSCTEGALLLELYTRDGIGTMISNDMYEGMRAAGRQDLEAICTLLAPLEKNGVLVKRSEKQLLHELPNYTVMERDANIIACAALFPFFREKCGEVAAFVVCPECRGHGLGDNLLAYLEKHAAEMGLESLFLLTTRTADWFVQRGFIQADSSVVPEERRARINLQRNSKYFVKYLKEIPPRPVGVPTATSADRSSSSRAKVKTKAAEEEDGGARSAQSFNSSEQPPDLLGEYDW